MTQPDFRAELLRLVNMYEALGGDWAPGKHTNTWHHALARARVALAQREVIYQDRDETGSYVVVDVRAAPPPEPPTDHELREMFDENDWNYISPETFEDIARAVLERWVHG